MPATSIHQTDKKERDFEKKVGDSEILAPQKIEIVDSSSGSSKEKTMNSRIWSNQPGGDQEGKPSAPKDFDDIPKVENEPAETPSGKKGPIFKNLPLFLIWSASYLSSGTYLSFTKIAAIIYYPSLKNTEFNWSDEEGPFYLSLLSSSMNLGCIFATVIFFSIKT